MKTEKMNRGLIAKTMLAGIAIMLLFSAAPYKASQEDPTSRLVTICHFGRTIRVDLASLNYHRAHGDRLGSCLVPEKINK